MLDFGAQETDVMLENGGMKIEVGRLAGIDSGSFRGRPYISIEAIQKIGPCFESIWRSL